MCAQGLLGDKTWEVPTGELTDAAPRAETLPGLDALRALAVVAVVAFHLGIGWAPGGYLGVSLFFTLSGFLVTRNLLVERSSTGRIQLLDFWRRRARRLLPAAWLTIAGVAVAATVWTGWGRRVGADPADEVAALLNVANWRFLGSGSSYASLFASPSPLLHFWSLAVEEQAYVVLPLIVVLGLGRSGRVRPARLAVIAGVLATASFALPAFVTMSHDRVYYGTDTRLGEILLGACLAAIATRTPQTLGTRSRRVITIVAFAGFVVLATQVSTRTTWVGRGLLPLTAVISCALLVVATQRRGVFVVLGRTRAIGGLGRISYVIYLVHWPVLVALRDRGVDVAAPRWVVLIAAALVAVSALVVRCVERPVRARAVSPSVLIGAACALAGVVVVCSTVLAPVPSRGVDLVASLDEELERVQSATPIERVAVTVPGNTDPAVDGPTVAEQHGGGSPVVDTVAPVGDQRPIAWVFGDSIALSMVLATGPATTLQYVIGDGDVRLGCGAAVFDDPPEEGPPEPCPDPAIAWGASVAVRHVDVAVVDACQFELLDRTIPGEHRRRTVGDPVFDEYVARAYQTAIAGMLGAGVETVVWVACPYFSRTVGFDELPRRYRASRDQDRVDALNAIIDRSVAVFPGRACIAHFDEWMNERTDDAALRPDGSHFEWASPSPAGLAFDAAVVAAIEECSGTA